MSSGEEGGGFPLFRKRPLRGSNPYGSSELFSFHRRSRQSCQELSWGRWLCPCFLKSRRVISVEQNRIRLSLAAVESAHGSWVTLDFVSEWETNFYDPTWINANCFGTLLSPYLFSGPRLIFSDFLHSKDAINQSSWPDGVAGIWRQRSSSHRLHLPTSWK